MTDALALHSGEYVERYKRKSLGRIEKLAQNMSIPDEAELADFGCGNGMLLQVIGDRRGAYHGVDFSPDFIRAAKEWARQEGLSNWRFHCNDIVDFCNAHPHRFDIATALDFSEHVADEEAVRIFTAIRKSMRPGATLYLHTPNREFIVEVLKEHGVLRQFPEHIAVRTADEMRELLVRCGFERERIRIEFIPHYNILALFHPLGALPFVGKFFRARLWIAVQA